jgi:hypothetical protein
MVCMTENKKLQQDIDKKSLSILLRTDIRDSRLHIKMDNIHSFWLRMNRICKKGTRLPCVKVTYGLMLNFCWPLQYDDR